MARSSRLPRPRLRCPVCGGAPRLPADLRQSLRCQCGAGLRIALVEARAVLTPDFDDSLTGRAPVVGSLTTKEILTYDGCCPRPNRRT